ncbi:hypothetical protein HYFRA_00003769 [Hymenoscyphus fraxineus]|uniref:Uncharacterized protein n=1 Tax=Hymenoscyphus fraxineus TaxID=746836 RepID=A0A9N9L0H1_9HELO|nr:hypothetical protein HYFRA_00003769 [Hymenoscyphus fraxineus]
MPGHHESPPRVLAEGRTGISLRQGEGLFRTGALAAAAAAVSLGAGRVPCIHIKVRTGRRQSSRDSLFGNHHHDHGHALRQKLKLIPVRARARALAENHPKRRSDPDPGRYLLQESKAQARRAVRNCRAASSQKEALIPIQTSTCCPPSPGPGGAHTVVLLSIVTLSLFLIVCTALVVLARLVPAIFPPPLRGAPISVCPSFLITATQHNLILTSPPRADSTQFGFRVNLSHIIFQVDPIQADPNRWVMSCYDLYTTRY